MCSVNVSFRDPIKTVVIPGSISGDGLPAISAASSPDAEERWISETYFIAFFDPGKIQIREALLIMASTLLGAGVSALLEAFLAGGTAVWVRAGDGANRPSR